MPRGLDGGAPLAPAVAPARTALAAPLVSEQVVCDSPGMSRSDRLLQRACFAMLALHTLAWALWPGKLWGLSHLAAWPRAVGLAVTLVAALLLAAAPRLARHLPSLAFPGARGAALLAAVSLLPFWLLRERTHFFGDGYLLIRDRGLSETVPHAPLLVRSMGSLVRTMGARQHVPADRAFALIAVAAGGVAVFCLLRLCAQLSSQRGGRWFAAVLLCGTGGMQLFFGHVEYYSVLAVALLAYLWIGTHALRHGTRLWPTWIAYGVLLPLHLSSLGLAPGQACLAWHAWRRGERRRTLAAVLGAATIAGLATVVAGRKVTTLAATSTTGVWRYLEPYFDPSNPRHAFGLFGLGHGLAIANDLALVVPVVLAATPVLLVARLPTTAVQRFLALAAAGGLLLDVLFSRELGPYRDWDILATYGFVYAAALASAWPRPASGWRLSILLALVLGMAHLVPWLALNASRPAALAHLQRVLVEPSAWSPAARGYLQEEIAIDLRSRGDTAGAERAYEAAVAANPADARYHVGLGNLYYQRGDLARAASEFETALRHRADYAPAHNNLACAQMRLHDLTRARLHAETAVRLVPEHPEYLTTLGQVEMQQGELAGARRAFEAALRRAPQAAEAVRLLAELDRLHPGIDSLRSEPSR